MPDRATFRLKTGLAEMLKGGVIMDVVTPEEAKIAEEAGASSPTSMTLRVGCRGKVLAAVGTD